MQRDLSQANWVELERVATQAYRAISDRFGASSHEVVPAVLWLGIALEGEGRHAEAEQLYRRLIASYEKSRTESRSPTAADLLQLLAKSLRAQGRAAEAQPLYERALSINEHNFGEVSPQTAGNLGNLAQCLGEEGQFGKADLMFQRAAAIAKKLPGLDGVTLATIANNYAMLLSAEGHYALAERLQRSALDEELKLHGPEHPDTARAINNLADLLYREGRYAEAEAEMRRALEIRYKVLGPGHPDLAASLHSLGQLLMSEARYVEAETLLWRALETSRKVSGSLKTPEIVGDLARVMYEQHRYADAEPLARNAWEMSQRTAGPESLGTIIIRLTLGRVLTMRKKFDEAVPLLRELLHDAQEKFGGDNPIVVDIAEFLGETLYIHDDYAAAEPLLIRALKSRENTLGQDHRKTNDAREELAHNQADLGKPDEAVPNFRISCKHDLANASEHDSHSATVTINEENSNICWYFYGLALWDWSARGGGQDPSDKPSSLMAEAFEANQRAVQSAVGNAIAHSSALAAAQAAGVGPQVQALESALLERDGLDEQYANATRNLEMTGLERRLALSKAREEASAKIVRLEAELKSSSSRYWDFLSPSPVSIAELQAKEGANAALLHENEALITFLVEPYNRKGLVFAVSKEGAGWAQTNQNGDAIELLVNQLRTEIDPEGYTLVNAPHLKLDKSHATHFERNLAFGAYRTLLDYPAIQKVIGGKSVLLFVPSGPLTALPPGMLITASPPGGAEHDLDPAALRATAWLLRSKAVALLPSVASLRTLRQSSRGAAAQATEPLLALADPAFAPSQIAPIPQTPPRPARALVTYYRDGVPLAEALQSLPPLPGTRIEAEALRRTLGASKSSVLTGHDASKAQLMMRNADGRLAQVRVLEFATHGLIAGQISELAEPGLALAAGAKPDDWILRASEASTLRLNADWVILSACNTASPDAPESQGLSGLSRSFFYAGAHSLLVSHWLVRDDVAALLIPGIFRAERDNAQLGRAEALRQATLAILDNPSLKAAGPAAWAPFTLIGDPDR